jgi:uncharacterized protein (DUF1684 family)
MAGSDLLDLWDYRRRMFDIYRMVRQDPDPESAWWLWRRARDELFASHPQSALEPEERARFRGLPYFPHHPRWRVTASFHPKPEAAVYLDHSGAGSTRFVSVGVLRFELEGTPSTLELFWLDSYGGGLFLPFRDATSGTTTYAGGRYLIDTAKGADLGQVGNHLVLDFNFAYHPSCVHSARWSCPLPPPGNVLPMAVEAGERLSVGSATIADDDPPPRVEEDVSEEAP